MRQAVWVRIVRRFQSQCTGIPIHLLHEIFDWLVLAHSSLWVYTTVRLSILAIVLCLVCVYVSASCGITLFVLVLHVVLILLPTLTVRLLRLLLQLLLVGLIASGNFEKVLTEVLSKANRCIITRGQHQPMQQVPYTHHIPCL